MNIKNYYKFIIESNINKDLFAEKWKSKFNIEDGKIILHHFGKSGLKYLDPKKWGDNRYTISESWWIKPRIYFYTNIKDKEHIVSGQHYIIKYPLNKLYPFNLDPLNFYDDCSKELDIDDIPVRRQVICIAEKAEKAGYDGMIYKWENSYLATIWVKVPVDNYNEYLESSDDSINKIKIKGKMYNIPEFDYAGWPIINGLSTDNRLNNDKDRKQRVINTIIN